MCLYLRLSLIKSCGLGVCWQLEDVRNFWNFHNVSQNFYMAMIRRDISKACTWTNSDSKLELSLRHWYGLVGSYGLITVIHVMLSKYDRKLELTVNLIGKKIKQLMSFMGKLVPLYLLEDFTKYSVLKMLLTPDTVTCFMNAWQNLIS